jgi:hypothetical protein
MLITETSFTITRKTTHVKAIRKTSIKTPLISTVKTNSIIENPFIQVTTKYTNSTRKRRKKGKPFWLCPDQ